MQAVAHAAVVNVLSPHLSSAVRAECEHDSVDTVHRTGKRVGTDNITEDHLRFAGKLRRALSAVRTRARTAWPSRNASSTTRHPMLPVAPTASTVNLGLVMTSP